MFITWQALYDQPGFQRSWIGSKWESSESKPESDLPAYPEWGTGQMAPNTCFGYREIRRSILGRSGATSETHAQPVLGS